MSRFLTIAKYVPAVLCGLLVVAWAVSIFIGVRIDQWFNGDHQGALLENGGLHFFVAYDSRKKWSETLKTYALIKEERSFLGRWECEGNNIVFDGWSLSLPIPALLTLLLPLSLGPFTRFRFPLWSYFAFIAVVAAELAFYWR